MEVSDCTCALSLGCAPPSVTSPNRTLDRLSLTPFVACATRRLLLRFCRRGVESGYAIPCKGRLKVRRKSSAVSRGRTAPVVTEGRNVKVVLMQLIRAANYAFTSQLSNRSTDKKFWCPAAGSNFANQFRSPSAAIIIFGCCISLSRTRLIACY